MTNDSQLDIRGLRKTFHPGLFEAPVAALCGIDLEVRRGEVFGFLGPNGAGKTTTLKAVLGLIRPDAGVIRVCGRAHDDLEARRRLGFMPENPYHYPYLTGRELLRFHARLLGLEAPRLEVRVQAVLEQVSMADRADRALRTYSKGMAQRLSLAQALLGEPELLILDEPMSGLDPLGRRDVRDLILAERRRGATVFFSSHVIPDVETLCDRVAIVVDGVVRATGGVRELLAAEAPFYEVVARGVEPADLTTALEVSHRGEDAWWAHVAAADRDRVVAEIGERGGSVLGVAPVRQTLEEFLLRHWSGGDR